MVLHIVEIRDVAVARESGVYSLNFPSLKMLMPWPELTFYITYDLKT